MNLTLRKISEDATTITLGWDPPGGAVGYRFTREKANGRYSHTWDGTRSSARFAKDSAWYSVEALGSLAAGRYPDQTPQPTGFLRGHSSHGKSKDDLAHLLAAARLDCYRDDALFENIYERGQGWGSLDARFSTCAAAGIKTFLVIADYGSQDPAVYASRCADLARRYSGHAVRLMIEVWNEPYMPSTYVSPAVLAAMCARAVNAVHALGDGILIGPNLDYIDYPNRSNDYASRFVDAYPSGSARPDFVSSHPYSDPQTIGVRTDDGAGQQQYRFDRILKLRDTLAAHGWTGMPMLASEWGWSSAAVGEANQATYARQGFELLKQWGVIGGFYYTGDRANTNASDNYSQFGILRSDGSDKPAVAAIGQAQA